MGAKAKHDISPTIRYAFLKALDLIEQNEGKTFSEIMVEEIKKDPVRILQAVSKFTVRESKVDATVQHSVIDAIAQFSPSTRDNPVLEEEPSTVRH